MRHGSPPLPRAARYATALLLPLLPLASLQCASIPAPKEGDTVDLYGTIRDPEGLGIEGINVFVDSRTRGAPTDSRGVYRIRVRPGRHEILLAGFRRRVPSAPLDTIVVGPSATRFDYQYRGLKVRGRFLGPGGKPLHRGEVEILGNSPESRYSVMVGAHLERGRYTLFVPRGTYYFNVKPSPECLPATTGRHATAIRADTTIDFSVDGNLVEGRIAVRGRPLSGATVTAWGVAWPDTIETRASSTTTSKGRYRLFVPNGSYTFFIGRGTYFSPFVTRWFHREITGPERIETSLSMTFWSGVVRDSVTGAPVESVIVWAGDPAHLSAGAMTRSDRRGHFRLELEPKRTYSLSWSRRNRTPREFATATAEKDSTLEVRVPISAR